MPDCIIDCFGDGNPSSGSYCLNTRGDIDGIAFYSAGFFNNISHVDADTDKKTLLFRQDHIMLFQSFLNSNSRADSPDSAFEYGKDSVADDLDDAPFGTLDRLAHIVIMKPQ